jgi:hypothetical protein
VTVAPFHHPIGKSWPCGSTSIQTNEVARSRITIVAFKKFVIPSRAPLGEGSLDLLPILDEQVKMSILNAPVEM